MLLLMRHGQSLINANQYAESEYTNFLTELGQQQAVDAGRLCKYKGDFHLFTSDYPRTKHTASIFENYSDINYITTTNASELNERCYGSAPFQTYEQISEIYGVNAIEHWDTNIDVRARGDGETMREVYERVNDYFTDSVLKRLDDNNVIIVSHLHVMQALLTRINKQPIECMHEYQPKNTEIIPISECIE